MSARSTLISLWLSAAALALTGCDKPSPTSGEPASGAATAPAASSAAKAPASSLVPSGNAPGSAPAGSASAAPASSGAAQAGAGTFKGSFKAKVGAVTPPKDAKVGLWSKDPGTEAVGEGQITLTLAGSGPRPQVLGEAKGALGELVISGEVDGKDISARVDPKEPNSPRAMTGLLHGKIEGSTIDVTLRVSNRDGAIVREAEAKLSRELEPRPGSLSAAGRQLGRRKGWPEVIPPPRGCRQRTSPRL